jgi:hypothetical protein
MTSISVLMIDATAAPARGVRHCGSRTNHCRLMHRRRCCKPCRAPCLCLIFPIIDLGDTQLYKVDQYDECVDENALDYCANPTEVYDEFEPDIPSQNCPDHECGAYMCIRKGMPRLPAPKVANYDGSDLVPNNFKIRTVVGDITFDKPNAPGITIFARVFRLRVKPRFDMAWRNVYFACEIDDDNPGNNTRITNVKQHRGQPYLFECTTDDGQDTYVVITHR